MNEPAPSPPADGWFGDLRFPIDVRIPSDVRLIEAIYRSAELGEEVEVEAS
jgi:hypothetical protein